MNQVPLAEGGEPAQQSVDEHRDDDFANEVVPPEARLSRGKVTMVNWAIVAAMVSLFEGALAATLVGTKQAIIGLAVSVALMALFTMPIVRLGIKTGRGNLLTSDRVFGKVGRLLITLVFSVAATYFAVFEGSVVAVSLQKYIGGDIRIWYAVAVIAMLPLLMGGVLTWLDKINAVLLPLYVAGAVLAVVLAVVIGHPGGWLDYQGTIPVPARAIPGWVTTMGIYFGMWLVLPVANDFSRFAKNKDLRYHLWVTFGPVFTTVAFGLSGVLGMFVVQAVLPSSQVDSEAGVATALLQLMGAAGLIFILVTQLRIQTLNFYLSSTNIQRFILDITGRQLWRKLVIVAVGIIAVLLMLTNVISYLHQMLLWLGVFFVGWGGIMATFTVFGGIRRKFTPDADMTTTRLLTPAGVVWIVSAAVGIALMQSGDALPVLSQLAEIIALAVAVFGYLLVLLGEHLKQRSRRGGLAVRSDPLARPDREVARG